MQYKGAIYDSHYLEGIVIPHKLIKGLLYGISDIQVPSELVRGVDWDRGIEYFTLLLIYLPMFGSDKNKLFAYIVMVTATSCCNVMLQRHALRANQESFNPL